MALTVANLNWVFVCGLAFCLGGVMVLSLLPMGSDCICPFSRPRSNARFDMESLVTQPPKITADGSRAHKMAVLVPFRDRFNELLQFVPHLTGFLQRQRVPNHIFVLNQVDNYRFNRAALINVGFRFTSDVYDYIAMHDVDLLPLNDDLHYDYPSERGPLHIAAPNLHPKYHYETFVGGILLVRREHYELMNGMSNRYWGWGLEDDEFYVRIRDAGLQVTRPENVQTNSNNTFTHTHNSQHKRRDTQKCYNQKEVTRKRDHQTGLNNLKYKILKIYELTIDGTVVTVLNIELECDRHETPWCDCTNAPDLKKSAANKN